MLLTFTKISFHVWPLPRSPGVRDIETRVYYIVYARLLLPCLGWGSVLCSYEQSICNPEAGSRLLHRLARELPLLPGLLSSLSDTARSDCIRGALKCWFSKSMKHSLSFQSTSPGTVASALLEAHVPGWQGTPHPCAAGTICCAFGLQICIWIAGLTPTTMNTSKQFHAQIAPGHAHFQPWWMLLPCTRESTKEGFTDWNWHKHHTLEMGEARRAHKSNWYLCNPVML